MSNEKTMKVISLAMGGGRRLLPLGAGVLGPMLPGPLKSLLELSETVTA
ncbi:MAG: hypothetical protein WBB22_14130 [Anaerolineae bacterium]